MADRSKRTVLTATAVDPSATVTVYPSPALAERGESLAGIGVGGTEIPVSLADEWLAAGLVVLDPPKQTED